MDLVEIAPGHFPDCLPRSRDLATLAAINGVDDAVAHNRNQPAVAGVPDLQVLIRALAAHPAGIADLVEALRGRVVDTSTLLAAMDRIALRAVLLLEGVDGAGITAHFDAIPVTLAYTDHGVVLIDARQHLDRGGPSERAIATDAAVTMHFAHLTQTSPLLAHMCQLAGVRTIISLPIQVAGRPVATLNLYSADPQLPAPDADLLNVLTRYTQQALTDFDTAHTRTAPGRAVRAALAQRSVIGQATGILMAACGFSVDHATAALSDQARNHHRTVAEQAAHITQHHRPPA